jgi:hypothetical protein
LGSKFILIAKYTKHSKRHAGSLLDRVITAADS